MSQELITAKLKDGITRIRLYAGVENYIDLKDFIEVRGVFGRVQEQPQITGAVINGFMQFTALNLPNGMTPFGFKYVGDGGWVPSPEGVKTAIWITHASVGSGSFFIKVEVGQLIGDFTEPHTYSRVCFVELPYEVVAQPTTGSEIYAPSDAQIPVISLNHFTATTNAGQTVYSTTAQQGRETNAQILATNSPTSFSAVNLPNGLSINSSGLISGTPTNPGTYIATITATNSRGSSQPASLRFDIAASSANSEPGVVVPINPSGEEPVFLKVDGVDVFFDLQSRALSLTPPKREIAIPSDTKVINGIQAERLLVKTGETLWLNVRFVKGTTPLDPVATGLRFGVAGKAGGSLLMEGTTFTKVGEGVGAYYRMRVTPIENEFSAIIDDYYDDDAVEQISAANENQPSSNGDIEGICEVALTTGSGSTIAQIKSDTLGVVLKRSIF
jgi:hypothetical protein